MDRLGDLLRMRATRPIGVGQDYDVPILEILRQRRIPFGRGALGSRRRDEADLGEGVGVFFALDKIDRRRVGAAISSGKRYGIFGPSGLPFAQPLPSQ